MLRGPDGLEAHEGDLHGAHEPQDEEPGVGRVQAVGEPAGKQFFKPPLN